MRFIGSVIEKLQRHPKRVVFPEGEEPRVLQAARQFQALRLGAPIVLGNQAKVKAAADRLNLSLENIRVIDPATSEEMESHRRRQSRETRPDDSSLCQRPRACFESTSQR